MKPRNNRVQCPVVCVDGRVRYEFLQLCDLRPELRVIRTQASWRWRCLHRNRRRKPLKHAD